LAKGAGVECTLEQRGNAGDEERGWVICDVRRLLRVARCVLRVPYSVLREGDEGFEALADDIGMGEFVLVREDFPGGIEEKLRIVSGEL
jgi:hypothetical protein